MRHKKNHVCVCFKATPIPHGTYTLLRNQCKALVVKIKILLLSHTDPDSSETCLSFSRFLCVPAVRMPDSEPGMWGGVEPACLWHFAVGRSSDPTHCWCSEVSSALRFFRTWCKWLFDLRWAEREDTWLRAWILMDHYLRITLSTSETHFNQSKENHLTLIHAVQRRAHLSTPGHRWSLYHIVYTCGGCACSGVPPPRFWLAQQMAALPGEFITKKSS